MKRQSLYLIALSVLVLLTSACQQNNGKRRATLGRSMRGPFNSINGMPTPYNSNNFQTKWGAIYSNDYWSFNQALVAFTAPMLNGAPADDQLGNVSNQMNASTGVAFWGEVPMSGGFSGVGYNQFSGYGSPRQGSIDPQRSRLHIEIYDDMTGQPRQDGTIREYIVVHIGYDQPGFVSARGSVQGTRGYLEFSDQMGSVILDGQISNGMFQGQAAFTNSYSAGYQTLGMFQVPACGFFVCN